MSDRKLVIISVDALNALDYDYIATLPTFRDFLAHGAHVRKVVSVYPTLTYVCHTAITTGRYPHAHGVYNNEYAQPHKPMTQDWRWFEKDIKAPTLFDYARQAGLSMATLLWPVMAGADVDWCVPEIWSPDNSISSARLIWDYGTKNMFLPALLNSHLTDGKKQPALDDFTEALSRYVLKKKKPDITAIHFTELDSLRHYHGLKSDEAYASLTRLDGRIQRVIEATKAAGTYEQTNFILLGDHGTHDFTHIIEVNHWFEANGLEGVYGCGCGGSCHIHLETGDKAYKARVAENLAELVALPDSPIKALLTADEAMADYGLKGDFHWVLEAKDGHVFRNGNHGQLVHRREAVSDAYKGDHGFMPEHPDMGTLLLMKGPDVRSGAVMEQCSLVDEGPTFAKLMGLTMEKTDGRVLWDLMV